MILKTMTKTLVGTSAQALATNTVKAVRMGSHIMADSGDTVFIGGEGVTTTTGFPIPTSGGLTLGEIESEKGGMIDLTKTYVVGGNGDVVRILYFQDDSMV